MQAIVLLMLRDCLTYKVIISKLVSMKQQTGEPTSVVAREIKQTKPFRSQGHEAVVALFLTADMLHWHFRRVLEPFGLTEQQYNVLRILRGAGAEGLPTLAIAERMVEHAPGITRMIDRLEAKDLVQRQRRSADRRCVHCLITRAGLELLAGLDAAVDRADREAVETLEPAQVETLVNLLNEIRAALR